MEQVDRSLCTGCFACVDKCPKHAICIVESEAGFKYPYIDNVKCINCGLCETVCGYRQEKQLESNIIAAYGLQSNSIDVLRNSTSGGAFTVFSDYILTHDGCVCGAIMEQNFDVHHVLTKSVDERNKMRGSKYVQSDMRGVFRLIEDALHSNDLVLFVGTPCQAAAVKLFFGDKNSIIVVDLLCHGVPSVRMFQDHIEYIEKRSGKKVREYLFRSKTFGWVASACEGVRYENDDRISYSHYMQSLSHLYYSGASLRTSCHNCMYRSLHRYSDITIADFWGLERVAPQKANKKGSSLVLINSEKGESFLKKVMGANNADIYEVPVKDVLFRIPLKAQEEMKNSDEFWRLYKTKGYEETVKRFAPSSFSDMLKFEIKKVLRRKNEVK